MRREKLQVCPAGHALNAAAREHTVRPPEDPVDISLLGRIGEKNHVQPGGDVTSGTGSEEGSVVDGRMRYPR